MVARAADNTTRRRLRPANLRGRGATHTLAWDAVQRQADAGLFGHGQATALLKKLENAAKHVVKGKISGALIAAIT